MIDKNIIKFVEMFDFLDKAVKFTQDGLMEWDVMYDLLFGRLYSEMQIIHRIDYYDPDSSYEADVLAYYNAAKPVANFYKKLVNGESEGE